MDRRVAASSTDAERRPHLSGPGPREDLLHLRHRDASQDAHDHHDRDCFDDRETAPPLRVHQSSTPSSRMFAPSPTKTSMGSTGRVGEDHPGSSPQDPVISVGESNVLHAPEHRAGIVKLQGHTPRIEPILLDLLGLEVHDEPQCRLLLLGRGRPRSLDAQDTGRPAPDPYGDGRDDDQGHMPDAVPLPPYEGMASRLLPLGLLALLPHDGSQHGVALAGLADLHLGDVSSLGRCFRLFRLSPRVVGPVRLHPSPRPRCQTKTPPPSP